MVTVEPSGRSSSASSWRSSSRTRRRARARRRTAGGRRRRGRASRARTSSRVGLVPLVGRDRRAPPCRRRPRRRRARAEQVELADRLVALGVDERVDGLVVHRDQPAARLAERVERAGLDQRLDGALVADHRVDLAQEVVEVGEAALLLARGDDRRRRRCAPTLRTAARPKRMSAPTRGEVGVGLVDVGRQHLDAHPAALVEVDRRLVLVVADAGEQRGHVLGRVVRLEVGRPVGDQAVAGGVRLVEGVVGERDQDVPQRLDRRRRSSRWPACPR